MTTAEKYVTAAYLFVLGIVLLYVVIYAAKVARLEREVAEMTAQRETGFDVDVREEHRERVLASR